MADDGPESEKRPYPGKPRPERPGGSPPTGSERPPGGGPYGERPPGSRPPGGRPYGDRPAGGRPPGGRPYGERPPGGRPYGDRPAGGRPYRDRPYGGRPPGGRPAGGRPPGGRPPGDRPYGDRAEVQRFTEDRPRRDQTYRQRPYGDRPYGDRSPGSRPPGVRSFSDRPPGGRPPGERHSGPPPGDERGDRPGGYARRFEVPPAVRRPGPRHSGPRPPGGPPDRFGPLPHRDWQRPVSAAPPGVLPALVPAEVLGADEEVVAGRRPVEEAFAARREAWRLLVVPERRAALDQLVLHATTLRIPVVEVEGGTLTAISGFDGHQGVALVVAPRRWATLDDVLSLARARGEPPFVLVLDHLEDPQNVGTLLRSAEACGVHGVLFPTHGAAPISPAAIKTSAGAVEHLLLVPLPDLTAGLVDLHTRGVRIVGADGDAPLTVREVDMRGPLAIVIGSEGRGLNAKVRRRVDVMARIPMRGRVASLNASVAGSVFLFEAATQRSADPPPPNPLAPESDDLADDEAKQPDPGPGAADDPAREPAEPALATDGDPPPTAEPPPGDPPPTADPPPGDPPPTADPPPGDPPPTADPPPGDTPPTADPPPGDPPPTADPPPGDTPPTGHDDDALLPA